MKETFTAAFVVPDSGSIEPRICRQIKSARHFQSNNHKTCLAGQELYALLAATVLDWVLAFFIASTVEVASDEPVVLLLDTS